MKPKKKTANYKVRFVPTVTGKKINGILDCFPPEPRRNCDKYTTADEAANAWREHEAKDMGPNYCDGCPFERGDDCARNSVCSIGWLYAKPKEGGAK